VSVATISGGVGLTPAPTTQGDLSMRKRSLPNPHASSDRHEYGMQLVIEFSGPASRGDATQIARRLIESLRIAAGGEMSESLIGCRLRCHELKQSIQLLPVGEEEA